ncbi:SMI1/KNR4 family protein [Streptomyces sp. NPDC026672]|uniref:SMI1/KNR4 family protein n=1 Tax=unclassified Streptomyces TaxID=2593676 RepID=UPI0033D8429E
MDDDRIRAERAVAAWARVESWLGRHAPRTFERLPPPAAQAEIDALERELDLRIPADVRAFYLVRNGTGPASDFDWPVSRDAPDPTGYFLPRGEGIGPLDKLALWFDGPVSMERREDRPDQRYLPVTTTDPDGFYGTFTDCTPGHGYGLLGSYAEADVPSPGESTFATYLTHIADTLWAEHAPRGDTAPRVTDGLLDWE